jgi:Bacterial extracellular solute-binding protein, family 7
MVSVSSTAAPRRPHCHGDRHAATQAIPRRWNRPRRRSGHSGDPTSEGRIGTDAAHRIYFAVGFAGQFPNAAPGADVELLKGVQLGSIDLACSTGLGLTSVLPEASELNIPFLFNSIAHAHAVLEGPMGESFRKQFAAKDLVMLDWSESGLRHMTNSKHPIVTPDDMKGLTMRMPPSDVMVKGFRALGAEPASPAQQEEDRQRAAQDKHTALVGMAETIESETATDRHSHCPHDCHRR